MTTNSADTTSFEIGPIRPPSEARSLLVRVTRSCPHNRCAFCPVYRGVRFSIRALDEILADIAAMGQLADRLRQISRSLGLGGELTLDVLRGAAAAGELEDGGAQVAVFLLEGGESAFLQDANSLVMQPDQLAQVLDALRDTFPTLQRITSYARAHTLTRRKPEQLAELRRRGLNRIHVGLESGSNRVLALVHKGVDAARQIEAGRRAMAAGMELSEYVMPGLGGREHSQEHALESARVLSAIDPHFIRLRTTAIIPGTELDDLARSGAIQPMDDAEIVAEIRLLIENLEVSSRLQSDHVLNLLGDLEGKLPEDRERLLGVLDRFLGLDRRAQRAFILSRRAGHVAFLDEFDDPPTRQRALELLERVEQRLGDDLQAAVRELMCRFV